jgi:hypothetical protein
MRVNPVRGLFWSGNSWTSLNAKSVVVKKNCTGRWPSAPNHVSSRDIACNDVVSVKKCKRLTKVNEKVKEFYTTPFSVQKAEFLMPKQKKAREDEDFPKEERIPAAYTFTIVDDD